MKRNRITWVIIGILSCFFMPVFVASWLFHHAGQFQFSTNNHGLFVKPMVALDKVSLKTIDQAPFSMTHLKGRWVMLYASNQCYNRAMLKHMYYLRQLRIAMGTDRDKVANMVLLPESCSLTQLVRLQEAAYPYFHIARYSPAAQQQLLRQFSKKDRQSVASTHDNLFFVDPQGRIMMRFPANVGPKGIHSDLMHLVRVTHLG